MLAQNSLLKHDPTLFVFLTYDTDEFEEYKQAHKSASNHEGASIPLASLKNFQLNDTFSYLYDSIKAKLFDAAEPEEVQISIPLDDILKRINEYVPFIDKNIELLDHSISFSKHCLSSSKEITDCLQYTNSSTDSKELIDIISDFQIKQSSTASVFLKYNK
eukprot:TRINITY_DN10711_c0_g1_i6.p1 TRINITY_DN10711_c0_g1~~TRINITY_DN10711_c0_g1_i6.p1  ORF type:complete len:161 (-),score=31.34 TRINITY_DN10711_c0_g1_i6:507-989(-)